MGTIPLIVGATGSRASALERETLKFISATTELFSSETYVGVNWY